VGDSTVVIVHTPRSFIGTLPMSLMRNECR
jgi:hypothetical protein